MNKQRWFIVVVTLNVQNTFWFKKNVKEVVTPCKRKRSEVDDDIDLNIEQTIYLD